LYFRNAPLSTPPPPYTFVGSGKQKSANVERKTVTLIYLYPYF
jgi:hypothetical protein